MIFVPLATLLMAASLAHEGECRVLSVAKQVGDPVSAADTASVPCPAGIAREPGKLLFDRKMQIVRARDTILAGENLGHAYFPPAPSVRPGDLVSFTVHLGHTVISRKVVALQAAHAGERFFARAEDGAIFSVPQLEDASKP